MPDGTFDYEGEIYRLDDLSHDHFAVRRLGDGKIMGELRFSDGLPAIEVRSAVAASESRALHAVAHLLAVGRGLLPLQ